MRSQRIFHRHVKIVVFSNRGTRRSQGLDHATPQTSV